MLELQACGQVKLASTQIVHMFVYIIVLNAHNLFLLVYSGSANMTWLLNEADIGQVVRLCKRSQSLPYASRAAI